MNKKYMTNAAILKKAIGKAEGNGYDEKTRDFLSNADYAVIFSYDFAKSFWGDDQLCGCCGSGDIANNCDCECEMSGELDECWQWHLKQMVLEEDPIKYLEQFLDKEAPGKA